MFSFLKNSVPAYITVLCVVFTGTVAWAVKGKNSGQDNNTVFVPAASNTNTFSCKPIPSRLSGYNYIAPLLLVESECEAGELESLKNSLTTFIEQQKTTGVLKEASFYFRDIDKSQWTGNQPDERYYPGSLMKVPDMMSLLLREEQSPGILNTKLYYEKPFLAEKAPIFISQKLPEGKYYTVLELLKYAIAYSDNNATILLSNHFDNKYFDKLLADFHLPAVDYTQRNYPLSPREISMFMRSIYNSSYLSSGHSELAAELLSSCDFKDGFAKGLPPGTKLIHKFGEAGGMNEKQLHESAIIYLNGHHYLFTVMTKGYDLHKLADVLSGMASVVYTEVNGK